MERPTGIPEPDPAEEHLPLPAMHRRNANRRIFRAMIQSETEERPLSWLRRRQLIKFAESMGLDAYEAQLHINAVAYAAGRHPTTDEREPISPVDAGYLLQSTQPRLRFLMIGVTGLALNVLWLR